jgi:DNA-binding LytR/AlgR family response regulator
MHAFETNGIAYLLKPFNFDRFEKAWHKYLNLKGQPESVISLTKAISDIIDKKLNAKSFKKRFTIQKQNGIYFLLVENIAFFEATDGLIYAYDDSGKKHLLNDTTLINIEDQLDPKDFFRLNRGELVHKTFIEQIERHTKNNLAIKVKGHNKYLTTSQTNTSAFRAWLGE